MTLGSDMVLSITQKAIANELPDFDGHFDYTAEDRSRLEAKIDGRAIRIAGDGTGADIERGRFMAVLHFARGSFTSGTTGRRYALDGCEAAFRIAVGTRGMEEHDPFDLNQLFAVLHRIRSERDLEATASTLPDLAQEPQFHALMNRYLTTIEPVPLKTSGEDPFGPTDIRTAAVFHRKDPGRSTLQFQMMTGGNRWPDAAAPPRLLLPADKDRHGVFAVPHLAVIEKLLLPRIAALTGLDPFRGDARVSLWMTWHADDPRKAAVVKEERDGSVSRNPWEVIVTCTTDKRVSISFQSRIGWSVRWQNQWFERMAEETATSVLTIEPMAMPTGTIDLLPRLRHDGSQLNTDPLEQRRLPRWMLDAVRSDGAESARRLEELFRALPPDKPLVSLRLPGLRRFLCKNARVEGSRTKQLLLCDITYQGDKNA